MNSQISQIRTPSINVFLGSTAVYAALELMHRLVELSDEDRHRVAIVLLDTAPPPAELERFRAEHPGELLDYAVRLQIPSDVKLAELSDEAVADTFISPHTPEADDTGSGGIRNNGHVAASFAYDQIIQTLDRAFFEVRRLPQLQGATPVERVIINIVAFLGGGTGSGMLPDIALLARQQAAAAIEHHHLNLFCLFPERFPDVMAADLAQRQANATACLLELAALSMKPRHDGSPNAPYRRHMGRDSIEVPERFVANEVYLFNKTASLGSPEQAMRLIGMELGARVPNASGAGYRELTKAPDHRCVGLFDRRGLPRFFSATCAFEIVLPTSELATAFAQKTAAAALRYLTGYRPVDPYPFTEEERDQVAALGNLFEEPLIRSQDASELSRADEEGLAGRLRAGVDEQVRAISDADEQVLSKIRREQLRLIIAPISRSPVADHIASNERRVLILQAALHQARNTPPPEEVSLDDALIGRMFTAWSIFGFRRRAVEAVVSRFDEAVRNRVEDRRLLARRRLLAELLEHAKTYLDYLRVMQRAINAEVRAADLERNATDSAAYHNGLDHKHLHRRHIFDVPALASGDGVSPTEALYKSLTKRLPEDYGKDFIGSIVELDHDLDAEIIPWEPEETTGHLVEYLRETVYLPGLAEMNLIDVLRVACGPGTSGDRKIDHALKQHFSHIEGLARGLVSFKDYLDDGEVSPSCYLGLNCRPEQQAIVDEVLRGSALGAQREHSLDPHRSLVLFGRHGISLGTLPDFYRPHDSAMSRFLEHEQEWQGDGDDAPYGNSGQPPFISAEMERLVMEPGALGTSPRQANLPQRLLRFGPAAPAKMPPISVTEDEMLRLSRANGDPVVK